VTLTVVVIVPELGVTKFFRLNVERNGTVRATQPNCYVVGTYETPLIGVDVPVERERILDLLGKED
jgi:hypothetical protein